MRSKKGKLSKGQLVVLAGGILLLSFIISNVFKPYLTPYLTPKPINWTDSYQQCLTQQLQDKTIVIDYVVQNYCLLDKQIKQALVARLRQSPNPIQNALIKGRYSKVEAFFKKTNNQTNLISLGLSQHLQQHPDTLASYQTALVEQPSNANIIYYIGVWFGQNSQHQTAIKHYIKAINLLKNKPYQQTLLYNNMARAYYQDKQIEKAIQILKTAIKLRPKYSKSYDSLGDIYSDLSQHENALAAYQQADEVGKKL